MVWDEISQEFLKTSLFVGIGARVWSQADERSGDGEGGDGIRCAGAVGGLVWSHRPPDTCTSRISHGLDPFPLHAH